MPCDSKRATSGAWDKFKCVGTWVKLLSVLENPLTRLVWNVALMSASVHALNIYQYNAIVENYRLDLARIYHQLYESSTHIDVLISIIRGKEEVAKLRTAPLLFVKARLKNPNSKLKIEDNCESVLDFNEGKGIAPSKWHKERLDRLVELLKTPSVQGKIVLHLKGFASELEFGRFSDDQSNKCNQVVANQRAERVGEYLEHKLQDTRFSVMIKDWKRYSEMVENRYYRYGSDRQIKPLEGLHALNQAVYITISVPDADMLLLGTKTFDSSWRQYFPIQR